MLKVLICGTGLLLAGTCSSFAQIKRLNCQTQGPQLYLDQNNRNDYESTMDENGCRYSFNSVDNNGRNNLFF